MAENLDIVNGTGISTYHLAANPELYEPSRNNAFAFVLDTSKMADRIVLPGIRDVEADNEDYLTRSDLAKNIEIAVAESSVPHFDIDVVEVRRGNSAMKFAGQVSFGEGSLKLNDYVGARTKDYLMAWRNQVYDVAEDVVNTADKYKFNCQLLEYAPDFSHVVRAWELVGCWPKSISEGSFSHDSQDKRQIDVTIVYDRAYPTYAKVVSE